MIEGGDQRLDNPTAATGADQSAECAAAAPRFEGGTTATPASSGSRSPRTPLRTWPPPTARAANCPRRRKEPVAAAPRPESAVSRETDADVWQTIPMPAAARCDFFVTNVIRVLGFLWRSNGSGSPAAPRAHSARGERRRATRDVRDEMSRGVATHATPVHHGLNEKSSRGAVWCSRMLYRRSNEPAPT